MKRFQQLLCLIISLTILSGCIYKPTYSSDSKPSYSEETMEIAQEILEGYHEIISIYRTGSISENEDTILLDENDYQYFVVVSDKYNSIDDMKEFTEEICTYKFASSYYYKVFDGFYKEIDGKLCRTFGDISLLYRPQKTNITIHHDSDELIVFSVPPEGLGINEKQRFYFTVLKTLDGWRINDVFELGREYD